MRDPYLPPRLCYYTLILTNGTVVNAAVDLLYARGEVSEPWREATLASARYRIVPEPVDERDVELRNAEQLRPSPDHERMELTLVWLDGREEVYPRSAWTEIVVGYDEPSVDHYGRPFVGVGP